MTETIYKWLTATRKSPVAGNWTWTQGKWRKCKGDLIPCKNGIHACRPGDLVHHIDARLWIAEADGERVDADDKIVVRRLRIVAPVETINDVTLRLFAAGCAADALPIFERDYPNDDRPRRAIQAARDFAHGRITAQELAAARAAAGAAKAAGDAARSWQLTRLIAWFSDNETEDWPIAEPEKEAA